MTQFDLRFQDLLRHSDWRVESCAVWPLSRQEWSGGESHQRVIHRADSALYVIPRLFNSIISPKMRSFATWSERRQLVKFAREIVRLDGLSAAWEVKEVTEEAKKKPNTVTIEFLCDTVPSDLDISHCRLSAARSGHEASFPVRVITERV